MTEILTIHRGLNARQVRVRHRILQAARDLIQTHGHEPIGMEQIAKAAGVSRSSMYRYFADKEHVICDAALLWGGEVAALLPDAVAGCATVKAAIESAIDVIVDEAESNLPMLRATMVSVMATGATADEFRQGVRDMFGELMGNALGPIPLDMNEQLILLGRMFFADLSLLSVGDIDAEQCSRELRRAAQALLQQPEGGEHA